MDTYANYLQYILLLPLLAVVGILIFKRSPNLREAVSLTTGVGVFYLAWRIYQQVAQNNVVEYKWLEILPGLSLHFKVDALGAVFSLVAGFLWIITTLYAIGYMRGHNEPHQTRFYSCFAIAISAALGAAYSENLFTLFVFYEILTLSTYPLVTHAGNEKAKQGGRTYLGILISTSVFLFLPAIIITWAVAGTLSFTQGGIFNESVSPLLLSTLLVLYVFGVGKAALMPIHRWLPAAMVAPTPVSALLHAVAVVKAGVFSILKICVFIFGADVLTSLDVTQWLIYLAGFTILMSSIIAMQQDNLKRRLAYSTVSQLGYITLGALLISDAAIVGGTMHIVMHAFGKITLFFCAGAIYVAHHKTQVSEVDGMGRVMPITFFAFALASLSIIGLPPLGGIWSKWFLMLGALDSGYLSMMVVLSVSSLLNIVYLLEIPARAFFRPAPANAKLHEAPSIAVAAIMVTSLMCIVMFAYASDIHKFLIEARLVS